MRAAQLGRQEMRVDDQDQFAEHFASAQAENNAAAKPAVATPAPATEVVESPPASTEAPAEELAPADAAQVAPEKTVTIEELQAQLKDLQHRERSSANRVSVFMRENQALAAQIAELRKAREAPASAPAPKAPEPNDDVLSAAPDLDAAVAKRVQAVVEPLVKRVAAAEGRVEDIDRVTREVKTAVDPISQKALEEAIASTHKALDLSFTKQWRKDVSSAKYEEWLSRQPADVQHQAAHAITVEDTSAVLARFYAVHGWPKREPEQPQPTPAGNSQQERLRLASGIQPRGAPRAQAGPKDDDFEGHFAIALKSQTA